METTSTMKSGVLTPKARDEIVHSLATLIMVYTAHPSSSDYNAVCSNLIKKHPVLRDCVGSGYVSIMILNNYTLMHLCDQIHVGFLEKETTPKV